MRLTVRHYFDELNNEYQELLIDESVEEEEKQPLTREEDWEEEIKFWGFRQRWPGKI